MFKILLFIILMLVIVIIIYQFNILIKEAVLDPLKDYVKEIKDYIKEKNIKILPICIVSILLILFSLYKLDFIKSNSSTYKFLDIYNAKYETFDLNRMENDIKIEKNKYVNLLGYNISCNPDLIPEQTYILYMKNRNIEHIDMKYIYRPEFLKDDKPFTPDLKKDVIKKIELKDIVIMENGNKKNVATARIYFY